MHLFCVIALQPTVLFLEAYSWRTCLMLICSFWLAAPFFSLSILATIPTTNSLPVFHRCWMLATCAHWHQFLLAVRYPPLMLPTSIGIGLQPGFSLSASPCAGPTHLAKPTVFVCIAGKGHVLEVMNHPCFWLGKLMPLCTVSLSWLSLSLSLRLPTVWNFWWNQCLIPGSR